MAVTHDYNYSCRKREYIGVCAVLGGVCCSQKDTRKANYVISPPLMSDDAADDITYTPCTKCVLKKNKVNNKQKHIDRERPVQRCVRRLEHEKYLVGITQLVGPLVLLRNKMLT